MPTRFGVALLAALLLGLSACGGLPDTLRKRARTQEQRIVTLESQIKEKKRDLESRLGRSGAEFLRPYAERERWTERFAEARSELEHARALRREHVLPILEENRQETADSLKQQLLRVRNSLDQVREHLHYPAKRAGFLVDVKERAPELVGESESTVTTLETTLGDLEREVTRAADDYSEKREDLGGRLAAIRSAAEQARENSEVARAELPAVQGGAGDLARLGDAVEATRKHVAEVGDASGELRSRIQELYRSYSKTLTDMKEVYLITIGRTSWNNYYDFPRENEYRYEREVSEETLEYLEGWGERAIASGRTVSIDRNVWNALNLNPRERLPRGDSAAEFWVGDSKVNYYHRYSIVEGSEARDGDWEPVSEKLYETHAEDLGMDIVSKPYGSYEDEALRQATPPGLANVGNPAYGRWEQDHRGRRQWAWGNNFLFYYLMFGGRRHYYYHDGWSHWNRGYRGHRSYYGRGGRTTYGTYGSTTQSSPRYAKSTVARRGGFQRPDATVRGAGPASRGGGPGSRGK